MTALFARLLGDRFDRLPSRVRALHASEETRTYAGRADVDRGTGFLSRWLAAATRLPAGSANQPLQVTIEPANDGERWTRRFADRAMPSQLRNAGGLLGERLGLAAFEFRLDVHDDELTWRVERVRALGIPLPARWFGGVVAREFEHGDRYCFDVRAELPVVGLLVHYRGWLDVG